MAILRGVNKLAARPPQAASLAAKETRARSTPAQTLGTNRLAGMLGRGEPPISDHPRDDVAGTILFSIIYIIRLTDAGAKLGCEAILVDGLPQTVPPASSTPTCLSGESASTLPHGPSAPRSF